MEALVVVVIRAINIKLTRILCFLVSLVYLIYYFKPSSRISIFWFSYW